ncbi:MAG TPA: ABC transporter permease [Tepidiformaceae bacterium]|nr:ABC transporter permease [Tepidiformaceae bacterium]
MIRYILARVIQAIPVLLIASVAVFFVLRLVPGDPASALAGENASQERVDEIRKDLGLEGPVAVQYVHWLRQVATGDLGTSVLNGLAVRRLIGLAARPTIELALVAYPLALAIGIPLGAAAGARPRSRWDLVATAYTTLAIGVPGFLTAIVMLWVFAIELDWLPASGYVSLLDDPGQAALHLAMPAATLAAGLSAVLARYTRTAVSQALTQDYIRTARAKGLPERAVVMRHALRAALVPVVTVAALQVGQLLSGAVVVEQVFTRPGMGRLMVGAITGRDYPVVQGGLLVLVATFVLVNLAADILAGIADPRAVQR